MILSIFQKFSIINLSSNRKNFNDFTPDFHHCLLNHLEGISFQIANTNWVIWHAQNPLFPFLPLQWKHKRHFNFYVCLTILWIRLRGEKDNLIYLPTKITNSNFFSSIRMEVLQQWINLVPFYHRLHEINFSVAKQKEWKKIVIVCFEFFVAFSTCLASVFVSVAPCFTSSSKTNTKIHKLTIYFLIQTRFNFMNYSGFSLFHSGKVFLQKRTWISVALLCGVSSFCWCSFRFSAF